MKKTIRPSSYLGEIAAPPSKSYLQRAIALATLCSSPCVIDNYYASNDAKVAIQIAKAMGNEISFQGNAVTISGGREGKLKNLVLNCCEAGLSTRMFSPIAAYVSENAIITGEGSILNRPIDMIEEALSQLGLQVSSKNGFLPLEISGNIRGGKIMIDGSESSQLLTGLLITLPLLQEDSEIHVSNLKSIPYVQMTLDILSHFGINVAHESFNTFYVKGKQSPSSDYYYAEGDWSGAAFHLVGAAISGDMTIKGLKSDSSQADRAVLEALNKAGAKVSWLNEQELHIEKDELKAFCFDATHCPDLFPPLAALAANCKGVSEIKGISRLTNKESNRALTIKEEFEKLGIQVENKGDVMYVHGSSIQGGEVSSRNDHRIAMAAAILGLNASGDVVIHDSEAVNKSYPTFFEDLLKITKPTIN
jgi:3-phosphoshikimate 1-carboxyvinyltransferase